MQTLTVVHGGTGRPGVHRGRGGAFSLGLGLEMGAGGPSWARGTTEPLSEPLPGCQTGRHAP